MMERGKCKVERKYCILITNSSHSTPWVFGFLVIRFVSLTRNFGNVMAAGVFFFFFFSKRRILMDPSFRSTRRNFCFPRVYESGGPSVAGN